MKNYLILHITFFILSAAFTACKPGRAITKAIAPKDTLTNTVIKTTTVADSIAQVKSVIENIRKQKIDFKTFNAKIKLNIESSKENIPDLNAFVKIIKDSVVWVSIVKPILGINFEAFRVYITKDSIILIDKTNKEVHYRSIGYLQEIANIPFDFKTIQDLLVGNPVFFNEKNVTVKKFEKYTLVNTIDNGFKNLITLAMPGSLLEHCKLDDIDVAQNRTADFTFSDYNNSAGFPFATQREVIATEKNKLVVNMNFKQYEFNKELSVSFSIPKNYKKN